MLSVSNLTVFYGKIKALEKISLTVGVGELVSVIGGNGAGKTTLVKSIMGLLPIKEGKVLFKGTDLSAVKPWERVQHKIAYVPEGARVFRDLTVKENLKMGAFSRKDNQIEEDLEQIYLLFPRLKNRSGQIAGTLSGGEQQMLAIARCLMLRPQLLLIDEMSIGLMPVLISKLFELIKDLASRNISILLIEQNAKKALEISHRGYLLENGQVLLSGESKVLMKDSRVKSAYLGG
jgi:branched-chain amino acid transport system ATP-binding protein